METDKQKANLTLPDGKNISLNVITDNMGKFLAIGVESLVFSILTGLRISKNIPIS